MTDNEWVCYDCGAKYDEEDEEESKRHYKDTGHKSFFLLKRGEIEVAQNGVLSIEDVDRMLDEAEKQYRFDIKEAEKYRSKKEYRKFWEKQSYKHMEEIKKLDKMLADLGEW